MIRASSGISSPGEPVGIARAVPALVARADDRADLLELLDRREDPLAERRGASRSRGAPPAVSGPGLARISAGIADLADVVEERAELDALQRRLVERRARRPTRSAMSVIQRACEDVYSSFASSAFASASTVARKVRSSEA